MKKLIASVALVLALTSVPAVANGPDPMPGCSKSCPKCCVVNAADLAKIKAELAVLNGPDPVPCGGPKGPKCNPGVQ